MIIDVAYFAAVTILCCASADSVTTSILLPAGLFVTDQPFQPPTFVGEVTVTRSTTYYTLDCEAGTAASVFNPQAEEEGDDGLCSGGSYTFSENLASTQYLYNSYLVEDNEMASATAAASTSLNEEQTYTYLSTINCGPFGTSGSATCTTTCSDIEDNSSDYPINNAPYSTNIESSLYTVFFTVASAYSAASSTVPTSAMPSPTSSAATAKPTKSSSPASSPLATAPPVLGPSAKVGIALGVPLGACALAGVALLLYRHGRHKERSRMNQLGNLAPLGGFTSESDGKKVPEVGVADQTLGRQPPVYSMEMQG